MAGTVLLSEGGVARHRVAPSLSHANPNAPVPEHSLDIAIMGRSIVLP
jgi:hypothetical protein